MGYNTTVVILNDHLHTIYDDLTYGRKLYNAIMTSKRPEGMLRDHAPGTQVIGMHHADDIHLYTVGCNHGRDHGRVAHWTQCDNDEAILRALADKLGYTIRKKPQRKG